jgi:hypothetical protein
MFLLHGYLLKLQSYGGGKALRHIIYLKVRKKLTSLFGQEEGLLEDGTALFG